MARCFTSRWTISNGYEKLLGAGVEFEGGRHATRVDMIAALEAWHP
jgi:hypothetical protein